MAQGFGLIVYPVRDISSAKALYGSLLGVEPYTDAPYYVGFRVGDQEIGLDPQGHQKGSSGPLPYWPVSDLKQTLEQLKSAGAQVHQDISSVGPGRQIAVVKDADGNLTGLVQGM